MSENNIISTEESQEALEMPGKGYHESALEIHPQTTIIRRRGFQMVEEVVPAFIKISTDFKGELANIDGNALKVWVFIALSINRNTEEAHPGVRTIAGALKMGENTVIAKIKELEALGLLLVNREDRKYNIYKIPEYVSANTKITASKTEADEKTASVKPQTASVNDQTASIAWRLNQNNQSQPESSTTGVASQNCMSFYQNNIGMLTPIIADALQDAEATFGAVWVCEAIREAVRSEARSWKYCEAILKRWQRDGFKSQKQNGGTHAKSNSTNPDSPKPTETDLANARSVLAKRRAKAALPGV